MTENGHLSGSQEGGGKGNFWTLKMEFPGFPDFGLCRGRGGSQSLRREIGAIAIYDFGALSSAAMNPKDPAVLKILRHSNSLSP